MYSFIADVGRWRDGTNRRVFITVGSAVSVVLSIGAAAQEGYHGVGHDKWHQGFYSTLKRNDGQGSCCNLMDCRPTQSRIVGDHYEVKVEGVWTPVPYDKINNVVAPDGGAHVCAPRQVGPTRALYSASFYLRRADVSTYAAGHRQHCALSSISWTLQA